MKKEQLINKYEVYIRNLKNFLQGKIPAKERLAAESQIACYLEVIDDLKKL